jgi:hypothetical protein
MREREHLRVADSSLRGVRAYVNKKKLIRTYATDENSDRLFGLWLLNLRKVLIIKEWFSNKTRSVSTYASQYDKMYVRNSRTLPPEI